MEIYVDPTELREGTRLDSQVSSKAHTLPGLEDRTGADLLLSITELPLPDDNDALLRAHCQDGILVQLKRFNDFQSSIMDSTLFHSLLKMLEWTPRPWLVVIGLLFSANGKAVVGDVDSTVSLSDKRIRATFTGRAGMTFAAADGALDAWRYEGGYAKVMGRQSELYGWLYRQSKILSAIKEGEVKELRPREVQRKLVAPSKASWVAALFKGVGITTAQAVFDVLSTAFQEHGIDHEPQIIDAVAFLTDYDHAPSISGITRGMVSGWRQHLGLADYPGAYASLSIAIRELDTDAVYYEGMSVDDEYKIKEK